MSNPKIGTGLVKNQDWSYTLMYTYEPVLGMYPVW
jgi:hypothetical protein